MVFIHGGYWMETGRADWSHLAQGAIAQGWAVAVPSYRLAPAVRISEITAEVGRAISRVAAQVAGPIALSGHSAGGHLAVRMICQDSPLPAQVHERITACVPISGIFDLRPLLRTSMREVLRLDEAEARADPDSFAATSGCRDNRLGRSRRTARVHSPKPCFCRGMAGNRRKDRP
ncbi:alpha/beta hydrolase [Paracoccus cavernae]|uniref:Alpha/beta hydrolase n=1 Tax=Paracoccus cavernae TaxID=1571207 RepID=A0ABT8D7J0_9RHOB|nr:alpha/beta hydrolase [Paracoccus cavernae]